MSRDALTILFNEARRQRPPCYDADAWQAWERQIGQLLCAMPTTERQWACAVLVADDLYRAIPGLPLSLAYARVVNLVEQAEAEP